MRSSLRVPSWQRPLGLLPSKGIVNWVGSPRIHRQKSLPLDGPGVAVRPSPGVAATRERSYGFGVLGVNPRSAYRPPAPPLRATISEGPQRNPHPHESETTHDGGCQLVVKGW